MGQERGMEDDLHDMLSPGQRTEFLNLIKSTMDSMQETICHPSEYLTKPLLSTSINGVTAHQQPQTSREGLSVLQIKIELDALDYFQAWKQSVLRRIVDGLKDHEIINSPQQQKPPVGTDIPSVVESASTMKCQTPSKLLSHLPGRTKLLLSNSLLHLLLSLNTYNAHSRALLLKVSADLGVSINDVVENETKVARGLVQIAQEISAIEEAKTRAEQSKARRRWKIALASAAGATLVGVTGGLAAPMVAGGIGALLGALGLGGTIFAGYAGALAGNSLVIGGIFGAFGATMTSRVSAKYTRQIKDFAFIPIRGLRIVPNVASPMTPDYRLRVTVGISGWFTEAQDIVYPWLVLGDDSDAFALRWEVDALLRLGNSLEGVVKRLAFTIAAKQLLRKTLLAPIAGPLVIPVIVAKLSRLIDNPFGVAKTRAGKAGEILADVLINKAQGERPVTLIGYSMGARVIYTCLLSLAKRRAFGLIESAILLGSPVSSNLAQWRLIRTVVSGRLVNVYSRKDHMLRLCYRAQSLHMNVVGIQPITGIPGVENFDASEIVSGHTHYPLVIGVILHKIGFGYLDENMLQLQLHRFCALTKKDKILVDCAEEQRHETNRSSAQPNPQ
ncbi:hypothetical protein LOZ53_000271 [Ophidiomyces ophidiicola]|nr:hypothetical protein LOZ55_001800 [Ophidiomyces ophidiicola]KAI1993773.1 hypothetical protein LOZ54_001278 [Ophidiomyces ophidiicola]KAI1997661.1 hypothetical protein LOZ53_000271 [Ophidiomyces ophidiicola]KAI1999553.1 hypothetical protein LOZ51_002044 [Ophidiomyces ophidiicola]